MDFSAESIRTYSVTMLCIWSAILLRYHRDKKLILMHCAIEARDPFFSPHWSLLKLKTPFFSWRFWKNLTFELIFPPCLCLSGLLAVRYLRGKKELLIVFDITPCSFKLGMCGITQSPSHFFTKQKRNPERRHMAWESGTIPNTMGFS